MGPAYLKLCVISHHSLETDSNTLDDTKKDGAHDCGVASSLKTSTDSERTASAETSEDSIPCILLLPDALNGAITAKEH